MASPHYRHASQACWNHFTRSDAHAANALNVLAHTSKMCGMLTHTHRSSLDARGPIICLVSSPCCHASLCTTKRLAQAEAKLARQPTHTLKPHRDTKMSTRPHTVGSKTSARTLHSHAIAPKRARATTIDEASGEFHSN